PRGARRGVAQSALQLISAPGLPQPAGELVPARDRPGVRDGRRRLGGPLVSRLSEPFRSDPCAPGRGCQDLRVWCHPDLPRAQVRWARLPRAAGRCDQVDRLVERLPGPRGLHRERAGASSGHWPQGQPEADKPPRAAARGQEMDPRRRVLRGRRGHCVLPAVRRDVLPRREHWQVAQHCKVHGGSCAAPCLREGVRGEDRPDAGGEVPGGPQGRQALRHLL
ncbi:unnamed protein product, partial [Prorocentrum cordatum]